MGAKWVDEAAVLAGWAAGESDYAIADRLGVHFTGVFKVRRRLGLPAHPRKDTEPTAEQVEAVIAGQLAKGKPKWWDHEERNTSNIYELYAAGRPY